MEVHQARYCGCVQVSQQHWKSLINQHIQKQSIYTHNIYWLKWTVHWRRAVLRSPLEDSLSSCLSQNQLELIGITLTLIQMEGYIQVSKESLLSREKTIQAITIERSFSSPTTGMNSCGQTQGLM